MLEVLRGYRSLDLTFLGGLVRDVALYYPYIVPSDGWLKANLLLFDEVRSIAPIGIDIEEESPLLRWLVDEGLWRAESPPESFGEDYFEEVGLALQEFATQSVYLATTGRIRPEDLTILKLGKLDYAIEEQLGMFGLSITTSRTRGDLWVHKEVGVVLLAVTAKHIAALNRARDSRLFTSTDIPLGLHFAYGPLSGRQARYVCPEVLLDGLVPGPGLNVSIAEIVDFRKRYRDELGEFRVELDRMVAEVIASEDPVDTVRSIEHRVCSTVERLNAASGKRGWRFAGGALSILAVGASAALGMSPSTREWIFNGFGVAATGALLARLVRSPPEKSSFTYLVRAERTFGHR